MSLQIVDKNEIPTLALTLNGMADHSALIGVAAQPDSDLAIIAASNEFGAVIRSKKAIAKLYYMMVEEGLIDKEELPIYIWMKAKTEIIIPERSFLRATFDDSVAINKAIKLFNYAMDRALSGQGNALNALEAAADSLVSSVKSTIAKSVGPANHPLTIARKGHPRTLQGDRPRLIGAITREILNES